MAVRFAADLRPSADRSAVRTFGGRPAAGSQRVDSLGSCATQPACYSLGWDRQTDRRTDRGITRYPPYGGGHNKLEEGAYRGQKKRVYELQRKGEGDESIRDDGDEVKMGTS